MIHSLMIDCQIRGLESSLVVFVKRQFTELFFEC